MNSYEFVLIMLIFLFFPYCIELIYQITYQNINQKSNNYSYVLATLTSCYFLLRFGLNYQPLVSLLFLNIPLLLLYQKNQFEEIGLLSIFIALANIKYGSLNVILVLLEYSLLFVYKLIGKEKNLKQPFIIIFDLIALSNLLVLNYNEISKNIFFYIFISILFILLSLSSDLIKKYGESAISFHHTLKDLEKEKQLRMSLFQITHEIKNPITVCKGYLDMFDVNNLDHARRYVPILKDSIARVLILIEDFLQITKIKVDKDWMDATLLLEENKRNFELLFKKNHIKCDFTIPDNEIYIYADYQRLNQVLINLIKNGMEALEENKKMEVSLHVKNNAIEFIVKDYGKGMTKEQLQNIKTPFYTTKNGGTGLGLYLSDEIIKAHNGTFNYKSKLNQGTKVSFIIPYKKDVNSA